MQFLDVEMLVMRNAYAGTKSATLWPDWMLKEKRTLLEKLKAN